MKKKWILPPCPDESVERLARGLGVSGLTARVLANRGLCDLHRARRFIQPSLHELSDPADHPALSEAAAFLRDAVAAGKRITVFGDYDADGICATALLVNCLRAAGAQVDFYIPNRLEEGYGLSCAALRELRRRGTELVVTVDCGISAHREAALAAELGVELLITDHHEPGERRPPARYVLDPHLPECDFADRHLAGVGVAFKLAWALGLHLGDGRRVPPFFRDLLVESLPLVAIGTIADVVPLTGENRAMTHFGLRLLPDSENPGIRALLQVSGAAGKAPLSAYHVSFQLAPRLNAAGRMTSAHAAVRMLTTQEPALALELAELLDRQNRLRQGVQRAMAEEARRRVESELDLERCGCIVLSSPGWHPGVAGLVASRLAESFWRPTFIFCEGSGKARGSARSVPGFHMFQAIKRCEDLVERYGGHEGAAGLTLALPNLHPFARRMERLARELLGPEPPGPTLKLDAEAQLREIGPGVVEELRRLGPFGFGNPEPLFAARRLTLVGNPQLVGSRREHLAFWVKQGESALRVIAFGKAQWLDELRQRPHVPLALAFKPSLNTFSGHQGVELRAEDLQFERHADIEGGCP